jgi:hypothetical protein
MSWLQGSFGEQSEPEADVSFPVAVELIPDRLRARVYIHELEARGGMMPCWSYVTDGLAALRQHELVLTLLRRLPEGLADFPRDVFEFFRTVYELAEQRRYVRVDDVTQLVRPSGFLGRYGTVSLTYIPVQPLEGVPIPDYALSVLLITEEEVEAVKRIGSYRVTTLLGQACRYYPCPPWIDRDRLTVLSRTAMAESFLVKLPCFGGSRAMVRLLNPPAERRSVRLSNGPFSDTVHNGGTQISLRFPANSTTFLKSILTSIGADTPFALITIPDPNANGRLVWRSGFSHPESIGPFWGDGSCLTGGFIAFVSSPRMEDSGGILEDGFIIWLSEASGSKLREALQNGTPLLIPATNDGKSFALEWMPQNYTDPVSGLTYHAEEGWQSALHGGPRPEEERKPVHCDRIVYLTAGAASNSSEELGINMDEMTVYMKGLEKEVQDHFSLHAPGPGMDFFLQCEVVPGLKAYVKLAFRPASVDTATLRTRELYERLCRLPAPTVSKGPIEFQLVFKIWGGSGEPLPSPM